MATKWFGTALSKLCEGSSQGANVEWENAAGTFKATLLKSAITTDTDSHQTLEFYSELSAGASMSGVTPVSIPGTRNISHDSANSTIYFDCDASVSFDCSSNQTCQGALIYRDSGDATSSDLLCFLEFTGGTFTTNGQAITINFNANGVAKITY